jgi:RNA polymerase sigma factor (sigma-70 family)
MEKETLNVFQLTIITPDGKTKSERLPLKEYLQIVAASNFKQRSRMSMLYYHAEARNYAVIGTGNKNEHEQGFFVKYGDGGADIKPIAHLFKTQVFQLAEYLEVPEEIRRRTPTTDTYSAEQTQEEFFYRVPFDILDRVWYGWEKGVPAGEIAQALGMTEDEFLKTMMRISGTSILSLNDVWFSGDENDKVSIGESIEAPSSLNPDIIVEKDEIRRIIIEAINELPDKEKKVLVLYYYEDLTLKEIGQVLEVTESRVSQLHTKAILRLRAKLTNIRKGIM